MVNTNLRDKIEMGKKYDFLINTTKEYFRKLIYPLEKEFSLELEIPKNLATSNHSYMIKEPGGCPYSLFVVSFDGKHYSIKICEECNKTKFHLANVAAHEFGHFAVFRNAGNYELFNNPKNEFSEFFNTLGEGIAELYRKAGLKFLRAEFSSLKYLWFSRSRYKVGENLVSSFNDRNVSVKDLVLHPDDYKDYLRENCNDMAGLSGLVNIGISKFFKNWKGLGENCTPDHR